ncbi:MAG: glycoside hydrolase [Flavipsychrobacter sp.]|nr:glycoside hydrolase [Flavipsychrobacter sp.]
MPMKKRLLLFSFACIVLSFFFAGCQTNKRVPVRPAVAVKKTNTPKFIDSVYIKAHNTHRTVAANELEKSNKTVTTINTLPAKPEVNKAAEEPHFITYTNPNMPADIVPAVTKKNKAATKAIPEPVKDTARENERIAAEGQEMLPEETDSLITRYAQMIAMNPKDMSNLPLYRFVDEWYGTAYKWGGTDIDGIDCSGFSQKLYEDIYGVDLLRTVRMQHRSCDRIKHVEDAVQGDLVFFRIRRFRISHVGVYLANGYFVHASSSHGVVISNMNDRYWHRRYAGCGRIERGSGMSESEYVP